MSSKSNEKSTISENIKKAQNKKDVSQDRLPKMADVDHNTIIKIESSPIQNPTINTLSKIAKTLDVKVDDLIK